MILPELECKKKSIKSVQADIFQCVSNSKQRPTQLNLILLHTKKTGKPEKVLPLETWEFWVDFQHDKFWGCLVSP